MTDKTQQAELIPLAQRLILCARYGSLASQHHSTKAPYASFVNLCAAPDGAPLLLISSLALHTKNIKENNQISILIAEHQSSSPSANKFDAPDDPLAQNRISLMGEAVEIDKASQRARYLSLCPQAQDYYDFADFSLFRMEIDQAHFIAGFARIHDLEGDKLTIDIKGAEALLEAEAGIVEHMNDDHKDATALYATKLLNAENNAPQDEWYFAACDPEGCMLRNNAQTLRLPFPQRVTTSEQMRKMLVQLVGEARQAP